MRLSFVVIASLVLAGCSGGPVPSDGSVDAGTDAGPIPCDMPGLTETVSCGNCGTTTRFCTAENVWAYGVCSDEGECAPGAERSSDCGNCGTRTEVCGNTCTWQTGAECEDEGMCAPGTSSRSSEGCPAGQTREVECTDACVFEPAGGECRDDSCPTPGATEITTCGMCGNTQRFCTAEGVWSYGECEAEGVCMPGTSEERACGNCGTQTARCSTECAWVVNEPCAGEGECAPGEMASSSAGCPSGQSRTLTCDSSCTFQAGACATETCSPGATEMAVCGQCGRRERTCNSGGAWIDGPCEDEGPCMPGTTDTRACGLCGTQPARCTTACQWEPSGTCTGQISCPPQSDVCLDGDTVRDFDGTVTCVAGACSYGSRDVNCSEGCSAGFCAGGSGLIRGLGGPAGFGTNEIPVSDDDSSLAIPLTSFPMGLNFYGETYTDVFMNNNGNISFGAEMGSYAAALPGADVPCIAAWLGDVDTRGAGRPLKNNVSWFQDGTRFIATWHLVGYYNMHDTLQNSFQIVLTDRSDVAPGDFDVELRYEQCQWTTGDANSGVNGLGGNEATAGFDSASTTDYLALPGSGTAAILELCTMTNAAQPGVWRYQVRGGFPR